MIKGIARKYFEGKTCIFCGKYGLYKLKSNRVKCKHCKRYYSLKKLRRDLEILYYFKLLRKRNIKNMKRKIKLFNERIITYEKFFEIFQGWYAYVKRANTHRLIDNLIKKEVEI